MPTLLKSARASITIRRLPDNGKTPTYSSFRDSLIADIRTPLASDLRSPLLADLKSPLSLLLKGDSDFIDATKGLKGDPGTNGTNGKTWRPTVDASGNLSWAASDTSSAPSSVNIRGPQGLQGKDGLQGPQGPQGLKGEDGHSPTLDVTLTDGKLTMKVDGTPKINAVNIKGANGTNGTSAVWFSGTAVTGTSTSATSFTVSGSKAGDMYVNTSTQNVYRAAAANSWVYVCNIKGQQGLQGLKGDPGTNGANGKDGAPGAKGDTPIINADGSVSYLPTPTKKELDDSAMKYAAAVSNAETAKTNAANAVATANSASSTAASALSKADAALPKSDFTKDKVEALGLSYSKLKGLPSIPTKLSDLDDTDDDSLSFKLKAMGFSTLKDGKLESCAGGMCQMVEFAPVIHKHTIINITGLSDKLNAKADSDHSHDIDDIDDLNNILGDKAAYNHSHSNYLSASDIAKMVTTDTAQTISGAKTFSAVTNFGANVNINCDWDNSTFIRFREGGGDAYGGYMGYGKGDCIHIGTRNNTGEDIDALMIGRGSKNVSVLGKIFAAGAELSADAKMTGEYTFSGCIKRKAEGGGGWAYSPFSVRGADGADFAHLGVHGNGDALGYIFIGPDAYNSQNNLRISSSGGASASKFVRYGGTASQFLKADGSIDATAYLPYSAINGGLKAVASPSNWGNTTGEVVASWTDATGNCAFKFMRNNPDSGKMSLLIDGTIYVNEGSQKVSVDGHTHAYLPLAGGAMSNTNVVTNLNADLLDGVHNGQLTALYLKITSNQRDLNALPLKSGMFQFNPSTTNAPFQYGTLLQMAYDEDDKGTSSVWITQLASGTDKKLYYRQKVNTAEFSNWKTLAFTSDNVASASKLATARTLTIGSSGKSFDGSGNVSWSLAEIGAAASTHNHDSAYAASDHSHAWSKITEKPNVMSIQGDGVMEAGRYLDFHTVNSSGVLGTEDYTVRLDGGTATSRKFTFPAAGGTLATESFVTGKGYLTSIPSHTHAASDITSGTLALARIPTGTTSTTVALGNHIHAIASITGLPDALNGKADSVHTHTIANVTGLTDALNGKLSSVAVTDSNPTLAWGTKSAIATIDGKTINVTMPANPNSNTTNSAGGTNKADTKMYLVGLTSQATGTSYTNSKCYIGSDNCLYSGGTKVSVEGHTHDYVTPSILTTSLAKKADLAHTHTIANVTDLQTKLDGKSDTGHTHSGYADSVHKHPDYRSRTAFFKDIITTSPTVLTSSAAGTGDIYFQNSLSYRRFICLYNGSYYANWPNRELWCAADGTPNSDTLYVCSDGKLYARRSLTVAGVGTSNPNFLEAPYAAKSHTHDYAPSDHSHDYLPLAGGTLTGNLTVGSAAANKDLTVNGTATVKVLSVKNESAASKPYANTVIDRGNIELRHSTPYIDFTVRTTSDTPADYHARLQLFSSSEFRFDVPTTTTSFNWNFYKGNVKIAAGTLTQSSSSDLRLKDVLPEAPDCIAALRSLGHVVRFRYNDLQRSRRPGSDRDIHTGLIWQNARNADIPGLCLTDDDGYGAVNSLAPDLTFTMLGAITQNADEITLLRKRVADLEAQLASTEGRIFNENA